jgi:hypothetical protein
LQSCTLSARGALKVVDGTGSTTSVVFDSSTGIDRGSDIMPCYQLDEE